MKSDEEINRYKRVLLVHSCIYYRLGETVVSDAQWQKWANWLVEHNRPTGFYDDDFKDWDGTTGFHLPNTGWILDKAIQIKRIYDEKDNF